MPNITSSDIKEIVKAAKDGHYHISCTRVFELQHQRLGVHKGDGLGGGDSVDHPNRYFDKSRQLVKDAAQAKLEGGDVKKEDDVAMVVDA